MQIPKIAIVRRFAYPLICWGIFTGAASADIPALPPVIPTAEQLAVEIGIPAKELPKVAEDFAAAITQGKMSKAFTRLCARGENVCTLLTDYYAQNEKRVRAARKKRARPFRVQEKNIAQTQRMDFPALIGGVKIENEGQFTELADLSMKYVDCPRNLSAALAIRAEEFYPNPKLRSYSQQLFLHASQCVSKEDSFYERLHLRQGLYAYKEGDKSKAKQFFSQAREALRPQEKYRSLYWLGRIAFEDGVSNDSNSAWQSLLTEHPLSFYAIEAALMMKEDPIAVITNHRIGGYKRSMEEHIELNTQIRWLEALYLNKKFGAVGKWASWIVRSNEDIEVDLLNYVSTLKIASGLYRSNIDMLFSYFKKNPRTLNEEALRLLYPRPFFQIIQDASRGKIDSFLVLGLVRQESAFDSKAVSQANAKGLMQIVPNTARRLATGGHRKLLNERSNTEMGVKYLVNLAERFQGRMELVLAAYNAGPLKVDEWLRRNERGPDALLWNDLIPYMETRDYVVGILRNTYFYSRLYGSGDPVLTGKKGYSSELVEKLLTQRN